jgi:RND family efflux transporter MFP subunit
VGQQVQKGQPLMRLDPEDLRLSAAAQQANVEAARAKYTQANADETRSAMLVKSGVISHREYDQDRAALDNAKAQLEAAEAQARVSNNSSEYAILLADADGVIVRTLSEPGQVVAAGQTVIQLAHDGPREALINLPEGVRPDLGAIASARLYGQDQTYQAKLRQLSDAADPTSRTFEARYVLEGEAASAPLGSTVTITLVTKKASDKHSILVPVGAVYDRGSGPGVWIVDDKSEVKFRRIEIGSIGQEEVVVSHGVDAGERVVALGAHLLHEGQIVTLAREEKTSYANFSSLRSGGAGTRRHTVLHLCFGMRGHLCLFSSGASGRSFVYDQSAHGDCGVARSNRPGNAGSRSRATGEETPGVALV